MHFLGQTENDSDAPFDELVGDAYALEDADRAFAAAMSGDAPRVAVRPRAGA